MNTAQFEAIVGNSEKANKWYDSLLAVFTRFNINTSMRQAHFLAQIIHESGNFSRLEENLNYSAERLAAVFPARYNDARMTCPNKLAHSIANKPQLIGNSLYGGRMGNDNANDGYTYRGRGLIQLTGKANYQDFAKYIGNDDVVEYPDSLKTPMMACLSAGWYWSMRGCNQMADIDDVTGITKRINGGLNGLVDRKHLLDKIKRVLVRNG
jgi:putative chitinase